MTRLNKLKSIAVITCYFGKWPWYFPYFLHSCKWNPTLDFIIITDNIVIPESIPVNVRVIHKTLGDIRRIASKKLGFKVAIENPYKLCDYKPTHGFLFPEIIKGYDFIAHGDIDIVYGNIRNFITEKVLDTYDIINSRHDYITGAFCLYKNNLQMNTLFMESRDYKIVFSNPEHFCFDECNFLYNELANGDSILNYPENIQSMTYVVQKSNAEGKLKALFDFIILEGTPGKIKWDSGSIFYRNKYEAMFYHLVRFKNSSTKQPILNPIPESFRFTQKKIHKIN